MTAAPKVDRPEDRNLPAYLYDIEAVQKMAGRDLVAYASDVLIARATSIWTLEEGLVRLGQSVRWHCENAPTHDVLIGSAMALEKIIEIAKEEYAALKPEIDKAKAEGRKPPRLHRLIEEAIEALRSGMIAEMRRREPVKADEPAASSTEAAA